ncbi:MAG: DUF4870 domain-containing protein [Alphaproteobacteria bacterium]|nr:DUF4870 domain-containing protein [Alphaproteobacteria bacterium]
MADIDISTNPAERGNANLVYILYLIGLAAGITAIVGVVMAYTAKDQAPAWLKSHYHNQINIFWKAVIYSIISAVLCFILIGFVLFLLTALWYIVRVVKGMQALAKDEPIANPASWGF